MDKKPIDIVMLSYGKDSMTMLDLDLKDGKTFDHVIFTDTLWEFDELHEYRLRVNEYLKRRYDIDVITLTPESLLEDWILGEITRGDRKGQIRGIPLVGVPCYWRREAKVKTVEKWVKEKYQNRRINFYIGYAVDEDRSVQNTELFTYKYPLKERNITEEYCKEYIANNGFENMLYDYFNRLGCRVCPSQSDAGWYVIWDRYKPTWEWMKKIEKELQELEDSGKVIVNKYWFMNYKTTEDKEKEFKLSTKGMFDFSNRPLNDCMCYIG